MSLKKSDKIIAIIGVVILIIAGIGIVLYASSEDSEEDTGPSEDTNNMFDVIKEEVTVQNNYETISLRPKLLRKATTSFEVTVNARNLKSIDITVTYTDNKAGFLFGRLLTTIGADTLSFSVSDLEGNEVGSDSIKGSGMAPISIPFSSNIITEPIEAEDAQEAQSILESKYVDYQESYVIDFELKTGIWGKIRELLGKDTFYLEVNYTYCKYYLEPMNTDGGDDELPPADGIEEGAQSYAPMALPGKN